MSMYMKYTMRTGAQNHACECCRESMQKGTYSVYVEIKSRGYDRPHHVERLCLDCFDGMTNEYGTQLKNPDDYRHMKVTCREKWLTKDTSDMMVIDDPIIHDTSDNSITSAIDKIEIGE